MTATTLAIQHDSERVEVRTYLSLSSANEAADTLARMLATAERIVPSSPAERPDEVARFLDDARLLTSVVGHRPGRGGRVELASRLHVSTPAAVETRR